jgi:hypothetical protein
MPRLHRHRRQAGRCRTIATSRGPAALPTWEFTLAQTPFHIRQVAVDTSTFAHLPDDLGSTLRHGPPWLDELAAVRQSDGGRSLTAEYGGDPCATQWGGQVYETDTVVVLAAWNTGRRQVHDGSYCDPHHHTLELLIARRTLTVRLSRPLGSRTVLNLLGSPQVTSRG